MLRQEIFDYIEPGEELVLAPFARLIKERKLHGYRYDRFWCMDTFKEQQQLTDLYNSGHAPWEVWKGGRVGTASIDDAAAAPRARGGRGYELLCLGAHSDDLEIGCGGTVLRLLRELPVERITWVVLSGDDRAGARGATRGASRARPPSRVSASCRRPSATASSRTPRRRSRSTSRS